MAQIVMSQIVMAQMADQVLAVLLSLPGEHAELCAVVDAMIERLDRAAAATTTRM